MASHAVTGLFDRYDDAANAVRELENAGIPARDISLVSNNVDGERETIATTDAGPGAATGAGVGGLAGGAVGALAGLGMMAIPGVGPVVAMGWLIATAAGAAAGAGVGAAAGGIIGTFMAADVSEEDSNIYAEGIRRGGTVVTVKPDDDHWTVAEQILSRNSVNTAERGRLYRQSGWTRFDPDAPAYTLDEIKAERDLYL